MLRKRWIANGWRRGLCAAAALALAWAGTGAAQVGGTEEQTGSSSQAGAASARASPMAKRTLTRLHEGNTLEIQAGQIAEQSGESERVKGFGRRMVDDHGNMDKQVMDLAKAEGITLPTKPTSSTMKREMSRVDRLRSLKGPQFDRSYMSMMVQDHETDLREARSALRKARAVKDAQLADLLQGAIATMDGHLKEARDIRSSLAPRHGRRGATPPAGGATAP